MDATQILELKQKRAKLTTDIRAYIDGFADKIMNEDEKQQLSRMETEFDQVQNRLLTEEKQLERERQAGEIIDNVAKKQGQRLFAAALTGEPQALAEYQKTMTVRNAYTLGTDDTAGALTAPMEFVNELIKGLDDAVFMRQISRIVGPIGEAQSLGFPYMTADATDFTWGTENATATEETTMSFARREFKPKRASKLLKVSRALISHSAGAESTLLERILFHLAATQENAYLTGDGTNKPLGIFVASSNGIPTSQDITDDNAATYVTFDALINTKYAIKTQYLPGSSWVFHRDLAKMVAKIKDANDQYIWQPSAQAGQPDLLLGSPVNMSEYAPNTYAAGNYAAVFGNFKHGYMIADADTLYIQVLRELYATTAQIGYLVDYSGDGAPVVGEAFARLKMAASDPT